MDDQRFVPQSCCTVVLQVPRFVRQVSETACAVCTLFVLVDDMPLSDLKSKPPAKKKPVAKKTTGAKKKIKKKDSKNSKKVLCICLLNLVARKLTPPSRALGCIEVQQDSGSKKNEGASEEQGHT